MTTCYVCFLNITDGLNHVAAFCLREKRMPLTFEEVDIAVMPNTNVQLSQFRNFLKETDVTRMQPIKTTRHDDFFPATYTIALYRMPGWKRPKCGFSHNDISKPM